MKTDGRVGKLKNAGASLPDDVTTMQLKMNNDHQTQTNPPNNSQPIKPEAKQVSRRGWGRIALFSSITFCATSALATLHFLAPTVPGRAETFPSRVSWYLSHGQLRADSRTFVAALNFLMQNQSEVLPAGPNVKDLPVAAASNETLPTSQAKQHQGEIFVTLVTGSK